MTFYIMTKIVLYNIVEKDSETSVNIQRKSRCSRSHNYCGHTFRAQGLLNQEAIPELVFAEPKKSKLSGQYNTFLICCVRK